MEKREEKGKGEYTEMKMDMGKMKERGEKMVEGRPGGRKRGWMFARGTLSSD